MTVLSRGAAMTSESERTRIERPRPESVRAVPPPPPTEVSDEEARAVERRVSRLLDD